MSVIAMPHIPPRAAGSRDPSGLCRGAPGHGRARDTGLHRLLWLAVALAALLWSFSALASEPKFPRLNISTAEIKSAMLNGNDLEIQLTADGTRRLQEATTTYQGQKLELYLQDEFVVGAVPRTPISTGRIVARYPSRSLRQMVAPFLTTANSHGAAD